MRRFGFDTQELFLPSARERFPTLQTALVTGQPEFLPLDVDILNEIPTTSVFIYRYAIELCPDMPR